MPKLRHRQDAPDCPLLETFTEDQEHAASLASGVTSGITSGVTSGIGSMASGTSRMAGISSAMGRSSDSGLGDKHNSTAVMSATALPR